VIKGAWRTFSKIQCVSLTHGPCLLSRYICYRSTCHLEAGERLQWHTPQRCCFYTTDFLEMVALDTKYCAKLVGVLWTPTTFIQDLISHYVFYSNFEAFLAMFQAEVSWIVTLCSVVVGYQPFRGPCCFHGTLCSNLVGYQRFGGALLLPSLGCDAI